MRLLVFLAFWYLPGTCVLAQDSLSFGGRSLPEATVRASSRAVSPLAQRFTIEEVRRLPATFYDPARLVALLPGTVQTNDQANHLSVRGNSPTKNQWRLNGLVIVNPNHTSNAGTFYDLPTLSGGGVNALSAQVLDNGAFYADGLPAGFGGATGGVFNLQLRPGAKTGRRWQGQASLLGFDAAVEVPLGSKERTSLLANLRTSFTGLLAEAGVDFGGESIGFSDSNIHVHRRTKRGEWSLFAVSGRSYNRFEGVDPAEEMPEEQKDLYDINYEGDLSIVGFNSVSLRPKGRFTFGVASSLARADRTQTLRANREEGTLAGVDHGVSNLRYAYERFLSATTTLTVGTELLATDYDTDVTAEGASTTALFRSDISSAHAAGYLALTRIFARGSLYLALRGEGYRLDDYEGFALLPRLRYTHHWGDHRVTANVERVLGAPAIDLPPQTETEIVPDAWRSSLRYARAIGRLQLRATAFGQYSGTEPAHRSGDFLYSTNNVLETDPNLDFDTLTATRRYGLELEVGGGRRDDGWYYRGSTTLLRAESRQPDGQWSEDRYSVGWIGKFVLGREWMGTTRKERERTLGANLALIGHGGERTGRILPPTSDQRWPVYLTPPDYRNGLTDALGVYFRPDLRLYRRVERERITTVLALDLQNAAGVSNVGSRYFDVVTGEVSDRTGLGVIPVLSYRIIGGGR